MAAYTLSSHYAGASLLSNFDFYTGADRNNGFVNYLDQATAVSHGLVAVQDDHHVRLGADSSTILSTNDIGRPSVMLTSKESFTHGLFIADFDHMPASSCGSWPSFWAFNQDTKAWPNGGEIGIVEGANNAIRNLYSAHTGPGCTVPESGYLGVQNSEQCVSQDGQAGCSYASPTRDPTSYGDAFNAADGGVYALEWDEEFLKMWHFPRAGIPADIQVGRPQPSGWGLPHALFGGSGCDADTHFFNMSLVLNINFCGNYAGSLWRDSESCSQLASTCEAYVAKNPDAYTEAYWDVRYIDVYERTPEVKDGSRQASKVTRPNARPNPPAIDDAIVTKIVTLAEAPKPTTGPLGLKSIGKHVLLGCFDSVESYPTFEATAKSTLMTNSMCIAKCGAAGKRYAGVQADACFCASNLGNTSVLNMTSCVTPCPGDGSQFCGGPGGNKPYAISSPPTGPLTVYGNLAKEPQPPAAPGKGRNNDGRDGVVVTHITYTELCDGNPAKLCEYGYYATLTVDGCGGGGGGSGSTHNCTTASATRSAIVSATASVSMSVPMTTITQTCDACGPKNQSTVALTIPEAVAAATATGDEDVTITVIRTVLPLYATAVTAAAPTTLVTGFPSAGSPALSSMMASLPAMTTASSMVALGSAPAALGGAGTLALVVAVWLGALGMIVLI